MIRMDDSNREFPLQIWLVEHRKDSTGVVWNSLDENILVAICIFRPYESELILVELIFDYKLHYIRDACLQEGRLEIYLVLSPHLIYSRSLHFLTIDFHRLYPKTVEV